MSDSIAQTDVLGLMADYIRDMYIRCRRLRPGEHNYQLHEKWDGGVDSRGRQHKNVWPKIARFMFQHQLDASACMSLRFELAAGLKSAPLPDHIPSLRYLDDYKAVSQLDTTELRYILRAEKELATVEIAEAAQFELVGIPGWIFVLGNSELSLSPLFRYCLASSEELTDLLDRYRTSAILQYASSMDNYDAAWAEWIPAKFRKQVRYAVANTVTYRKDTANGQEEGTAEGRRETTTPR